MAMMEDSRPYLCPTDGQMVERVLGLHALDGGAPGWAGGILQAAYRRQIPAQYRGNPLTRAEVTVNVLLPEGGRLVVPATPRASFVEFYRQLSVENLPLLRRVISPSGTAKSASTRQVTPIKEITETIVGDFRLPGDAQWYGWPALRAQAAREGLQLALLFQGNGLYYNRGSALFDGEHLLAYPDLFLADALRDDDGGLALREQLAIDEGCLQRPLLLFVVGADGGMQPHLHRFAPGESYRQGMARLEHSLREQGARCALAASPPLIIPGARQQPVYLALEEILGQYHANDVRHSLYCPYEGGVLLSAELGRAQCLQPGALARSMALGEGAGAGTAAGASVAAGADVAAGASMAAGVRLPLAETLRLQTPAELAATLARKGYAGRFELGEADGGQPVITIQPLEGVYSHLLPFLTRAGRFGLVQTSGTRGNITGNDGPTLRQLSAILRDLNDQPPFAADPIIAAACGSQGNDVPNIVCRAPDGTPALLAELVPACALDDHPAARGIVTTPRVGIGV